MDLIPAVIKDEAFIAEVESYQHDEEHFHLWWLGQSGYLLSWKGKRVLIDPYLSDSLTKKYAATNKFFQGSRVVNCLSRQSKDATSAKCKSYRLKRRHNVRSPFAAIRYLLRSSSEKRTSGISQ